MPVDTDVSHDAARQIIQQAALSLAGWATPNFQRPPLAASSSIAINPQDGHQKQDCEVAARTHIRSLQTLEMNASI